MAPPAGCHDRQRANGEGHQTPQVALFHPGGQHVEVVEQCPGRRERADALLGERVELRPPLGYRECDRQVDRQPRHRSPSDGPHQSSGLATAQVREHQQRHQQGGEQLGGRAEPERHTGAERMTPPVQRDRQYREEHRQQIPVVPDVEHDRGCHCPPPQPTARHVHAVQQREDPQRQQRVDQRHHGQEHQRRRIAADQRPADGTFEPDLRAGQDRILQRRVQVGQRTLGDTAGAPEGHHVGVAANGVLLAAVPAAVEVAVRLEHEAGQQHEHGDGEDLDGQGPVALCTGQRGHWGTTPIRQPPVRPGRDHSDADSDIDTFSRSRSPNPLSRAYWR